MCPLKLDRILVPTDFSETSRKAFSYALGLAKAFSAEVSVLHVLDTRVVDDVFHIHNLDPQTARAEMRKSAEESMARLFETEETAGIALVSCYAEGIPPVVVTETADELSVDLIVIGTHGRTGLTHLLYGSTADGVLRRAPCPVLSVNP